MFRCLQASVDNSENAVLFNKLPLKPSTFVEAAPEAASAGLEEEFTE